MSNKLRSLLGQALAAAGAAAAMGAAMPAAAQQLPPTDGKNIAPSAQLPAITRRDTPIDSSGSYRSELQACRSGAAHQSTQACLEETRNARAALRKGQLAKPDENYMANALMRCEPLSGEEKAACEARVLGFGNTSGSVAGGGLLRWVETVVLPPGQDQVTIAPKTREPVVVIPMNRN